MSSSFRYTFTKLRSLPSSLKICLRRSGYCVVSAFRTSPTVPPGAVTASCLPVNWRSGVGIKTLAMLVNQLLLGCLGLFEIWQPAIGVVKFALLNREDAERIPRTGILEIGGRKIRVAIRMRVIDTDQIHFTLARGFVGRQQVFRSQFISSRLCAHEGVFQRHGDAHQFRAVIGGAEHGAAALVGVGFSRVGDHGRPGFRFDPNHYSSQKCSLKYFSALSHKTVTMMAVSPRSANSRANSVAACTLHPEEIPTSRPSSRARRRTMA